VAIAPRRYRIESREASWAAGAWLFLAFVALVISVLTEIPARVLAANARRARAERAA